MSDTVMVAVLALIGTLGGSLFGVIASGKLTAYRLESLEKRVQAHNNLIERMFRLQARMDRAEAEKGAKGWTGKGN